MPPLADWLFSFHFYFFAIFSWYYFLVFIWFTLRQLRATPRFDAAPATLISAADDYCHLHARMRAHAYAFDVAGDRFSALSEIPALRCRQHAMPYAESLHFHGIQHVSLHFMMVIFAWCRLLPCWMIQRLFRCRMPLIIAAFACCCCRIIYLDLSFLFRLLIYADYFLLADFISFLSFISAFHFLRLLPFSSFSFAPYFFITFLLVFAAAVCLRELLLIRHAAMAIFAADFFSPFFWFSFSSSSFYFIFFFYWSIFSHCRCRHLFSLLLCRLIFFRHYLPLFSLFASYDAACFDIFFLRRLLSFDIDSRLRWLIISAIYFADAIPALIYHTCRCRCLLSSDFDYFH